MISVVSGKERCFADDAAEVGDLYAIDVDSVDFVFGEVIEVADLEGFFRDGSLTQGDC